MRTEMPNYWYTPQDFKRLKEELEQELKTLGNIWRFWVVVGKRPAQNPQAKVVQPPK